MWDVEKFTTPGGEWFPLERIGREPVSCGGPVAGCKLQVYSHPPSDCLFAFLFIRANEQCTGSSLQKTREDLE